MNKTLLVFLFSLFNYVFFAQAPPWQWAVDATSSSPETALDVVCDQNSSNIYICGSFSGNLSAKYGSSFNASYGGTDGFLAKYDQLGNVLWAVKIGGTSADEATGVAVDPSGDVYVTGDFTGTADFDPSGSTFTLSSSGNTSGFLAKYSASGAFLWATKFTCGQHISVGKMYADANGIYITGAYDSSPAVFNSYSSGLTKTTASTESKYNMFGAKYNASGIIQWVVSGGGNQDDNGYNVIADAGFVYFEGNYNDDFTFYNASGSASPLLAAQQNNKSQVYIVAVTQAGAFSWQTNITSNDGGKEVIGLGITQDASNLYITGEMNGDINFKYPSPALTQTVSSGYDIFLTKLSKTGSFIWRAAVTGSGNGDQIGQSAGIDNSGNVILAGSFLNGLNYSSAGGPNFTSAGGHDVFVTSYSNTGSFLWSAKAGGTTRDYLNGMAVNSSGGIYIAGEEDGGMVIGTTTLTTGGGHNIFLAKLGCTSVTNNSIAASQTICAGSSPVSITGSSPSGGSTYQWQMSANSSTWTTAAGTSTTQNYSPGVLSATTYYRRNVFATGSCSSNVVSSGTVTIQADQQPSVANAGSSQTLCSTSGVLNAVNPAVGTGAWTVISGAANVVSVNSNSSQVTALSTGNNSFVWTVSNGSCPSSTSAVTVVRDDQPVANAGNSQSVCSTSAILGATNPTLGTGAWSVLSGSGNFTAPGSYSSSVNSLSTGTNVLLWTVSNGSCPSATSAVTIVRYAQPTSNAGSGQVLCATSATLSAVSPAVGTGVWSLISGAGSISSVSNPSSGVTGLGTGTNSFLWTVSNGSCPTATAAVSIVRDVQPVASAGSNQTVCAATATFNAVNPPAGNGIWSVISGFGNFTSPGSYSSSVNSLGVGTNSFLWTVSNGSCPSATSAVTIVRDAQPAASAGSSQTVCAGLATLSAVNPTVGMGAWSVVSGAGIVITPGSYSSQVTSLSNGINSFKWTVSNGSCPTATSVVSITRDVQPTANAGSSQTVCAGSTALNAVNPAAGTGAWTVLSGSGNFTAPGSYSSSVNSIGVGTNSFLWTVSNGSCPSATSAVNILRDAQPTASAGSDQTVCATSALLGAANPTAGTGAWSVLSGSGNFTSPGSYSSSVNSLSAGSNSFLWTVSNGSCPTATSAVTVIRDAPPTANAGSNQTVCAASAALNATNPVIGSGAWSVVSGAGNISAATTYSSSVTALSAGNNSFLWTVSNGSCPTATSLVSVTRDVQPSAFAGVNQTLCTTSAVLSADNPTVGTGSWSVISGGGSVSSPSSYSTAVTALSTGNNSFVWTVSNGSCPPATSTLVIVRDAQPTANAGTNQAVCGTTAALNAVTPAIGTGLWSVLSGSGNFSAAGSPSSQVTALSTGTNSFLWTVSNGSCPSATSAVTITESTPPTANAGSNQTVCASSATLNADNPPVGTGSWSVVSGSGTIMSPASYSTPVTSLGAGANVFAWTVSNGICTPVSSTVMITLGASLTAQAGSDQTVCASGATLHAIGSGTWTVISGSGNVTTSNDPSSPVTSLSTGPNSFAWSIPNGGCPTSPATVTVIRDEQPLADAGSSQTVCASSATLSAVSPTTGAGSWSTLSGPGIISSAASPSSAVTSLGTGTNAFVWTVSNGSCPTATSVVNIVRDAQPTANAGSSQTLCSASATLNAVNPGAGTGSWSTVTGGGSVTSSGSYSSAVTALSTGTNSFLWTVSNGSCPSATSAVTITRDAQPTANAGSSQTVCAASATLNAVNPPIGTGAWSVISGAGSISSPASNSSAVTSLSTGVNSFLWTVSNGSCPTATAATSIKRDVQPTASAGSNQTLCASSATLVAVNPTVGSGVWSVLSGPAAITTPGSYSSAVTGLGTGTNSFLWTVSNGSCPSATSSATVIRDAQPTASAGSNQTVCASSATLGAVNPAVGTGLWSVISGAGNFTSPGSYSSSVNLLNAGSNSFLWTVSNGSCPSATSSVIIARDIQPTANAGTGQTVCSSSATLSAVNPTVGSGAWSVMSGSGTITSAGNPYTQVTALVTGTNVFLWTVSNGSCPTATSAVTIIRDAQPTANAGSNQTVCASSATLSAGNPAVGSGAWSVISGSGNFSAPASYSSSVNSIATGTNVFLWTVSNGSCPTATAAVAVVRDAQPFANAGSSQTLCTSSATLSATNPTVGTGNWSVISGSGNFVSPASYSSSVNALGTGINAFLWTVSNGSCPSATSMVTVVRDVQPTANAGTSQTVCAASALLGAANPTAGTGAWSVMSGSGNFTSPSGYSSQVTSLSAGINSFLWTVSNGSCPSATSAVTVTRDLQPAANAGLSQTLCASIATLSANNPSAGTGSWSVISGSGNFTSPGSYSTSVNSLSAGSNSFLWTVSNGSCPSATAMVTIVRDAQPTASAGITQTVCGALATLSAVSPAIGTGAWSVLSGAGSLVSANSYSSMVNSLSSGLNSFLWTVSNGSCPPATSSVIINSDALPTANAGNNQFLCTTTATLNAINPPAGAGVWTLIAGTGSLSAPGSYSSAVTALGTGTNSFLWTVSNGSCPSATASVDIIIYALPTADAGSNQTLCASAATLSATNPSVGTGSWSVLAGTGTLSSPGTYSSVVTALSPGLNSFLWTVYNGSCFSATASVNVISNTPPVANAGSSQTVCTNAATLAANNPTVGTGTWTSPGSAVVVSPGSYSSQVTNLGTGANTFTWTVTNGICTAVSSTVIITLTPTITASAGSNQTVCASAATLNAVGNGTWSVLAGNSNVVSVNNPSSAVTSLTTGLNVLAWTISNGSCPTIPGTVTITRDAQPLSGAGNSQTLCSSTATLNAVNPLVGNGSWSIQSGTGVITSVNSYSSQVTSLSTGTNSFIWSVASGSCPTATSAITIVRDAQPTANAGTNQTLCASSATLGAVIPTVGAGSWSVVSGAATLISVNSASSSVTSLSTGTNSFVWTVANGSCPQATAAVNIVRDAQPVANAGSNQTICTQAATLNAVNPVIGTGAWSLGTGSGSVAVVNSPSSAVTSIGTGTTSFVWTVSNGSCPAASASVLIVAGASVIAQAGSDQTLCTSSTTLNANGTGAWTIISGQGSLVAANSPSSPVNALSTGTNAFVWTVSTGVCPSPPDTVIIIRDLQPQADAGTGQSVCTTTAMLSAVTPTVGAGAWSAISGNAGVTDANAPSTQVSALSTGTNSFLWTVSNGSCPSATAVITIIRDELPTANAGADITVCTSSVVLNALIPSAGTGTWSVISGPANLSSANTASSLVSALATGTNVLVWSVANGVCPQQTDTLMIHRDTEPTAAVAGPDQEVCGTNATVIANTPVTGSGIWKIISGSADVSAQQAVTNLSPGINRLAWVISSGACNASGDTLDIMSYLPPSVADAGQNKTTCSGDITFSATAPQTGTGTWSVITGEGTISSTTANSITLSVPALGKNILRWTVQNGVCPVSSDEVTITRSNLNQADAGMDQVVERATTELNALLPEDGTGKWNVIEGNAVLADSSDVATGITNLSFGNNIFRWTVSGGSCPAGSDDIVVFVKPLAIPNGFSPNNDGINDRFVISSLGYYSQVKISVFNRWGTLLYENNDYKNEWAGTNTSGEKLTDDTYYYILNIPSLKTFTGFVIIKQNK